MAASKRLFFIALGAVSVTFHIGLIFSGLTPNLVARPIHIALALPWVFVFPAKTFKGALVGCFFAGLGTLCCAYIILNETALSDQYGSLEGGLQLAVAGTLLVVVLEMARRAVGWPLPAVALFALIYGFFGEYLPGEFGYPGLPIRSFLGTLTIAEGGVWGSLTGISANIVAIFVIMGAVLNDGEAGRENRRETGQHGQDGGGKGNAGASGSRACGGDRQGRVGGGGSATGREAGHIGGV